MPPPRNPTYLFGEFADGKILRVSVTDAGVELHPVEYKEFELDRLYISAEISDDAPTLEDAVELTEADFLDWN